MSDLGELEDLYYATCAKLKERLDDINIRLANQFIRPEENYFSYNSEGFGVPDPVTAGDWKATLLAHAAFLYDPFVEGIMSRAVFLKHKHANEAEPPGRLPFNGNFPGLRDVRNMSSGMIFGSLSEKYRIIVFQEELEKAQAARLQKTHVSVDGRYIRSETEVRGRGSGSGGTSSIVQSHNYKERVAQMDKHSDSTEAKTTGNIDQHNFVHGSKSPAGETLKGEQYNEIADQPQQRYISPYNLDERAKKLGRAGGPEKPCICDPECICAPLCASDPTHNCLCEENALFCRVTECMDIDDLSYPTKAVEEQEAERASKEYMAQLMAIDDCQQDTLETSSITETVPTIDDMSTTEPYSTPEPLHILQAPADSMDLDQPAHPNHDLLPNGHIDLAAIIRKKFLGGSLSIWADEAENGGGWYREFSDHRDQNVRATWEANERAAGADLDLNYPHFSPYGRFNLQRIQEQPSTSGQRIVNLTHGRFCGNDPPLASNSAPDSLQGNVIGSGSVDRQDKAKPKTSLFANRLIGRSPQTRLAAPSDQVAQSIQRHFGSTNTSEALPRLSE